MFPEPGKPEAKYTGTLALNLSTVQPSLAGPKRPQDRVALKDAKASFQSALKEMLDVPAAKAKKSLVIASDAAESGAKGHTAGSPATSNGPAAENLTHGSVVIAAIT